MPLAAAGVALGDDEEDPPPQAVSCSASVSKANAVRLAFINCSLVEADRVVLSWPGIFGDRRDIKRVENMALT
jgi:hypothetical protein